MDQEPNRRVKATVTSDRVLQVLLDFDGAGVSDVATELDISVGSAHKHLNTLKDLGFVDKEGTTYHLGLRSLAFGTRARDRRRIYHVARPHVQKLSSAATERASVAVAEGGSGFYLYSDGPNRDGSTIENEGRYAPLHATASGKAMLAFTSEERRDDVLTATPLDEYTDNTLSDYQNLLTELQTVKDQGLAYDREERQVGRAGVAAPVFDEQNDPAGAIEISGPASRLRGKRLEEEVAGLVVSTAKNVQTDF